MSVIEEERPDRSSLIDNPLPDDLQAKDTRETRGAGIAEMMEEYPSDGKALTE